MENSLITIANFLTPEDAEVARLALTEEGIASYLDNAGMVGMGWAYGNATGWVKLQVANPDAERALAVLSQKNVVAKDAVSHTCPTCCVDLPPGFEVCWSCGASIGGEQLGASDSSDPPDNTDSQEEEQEHDQSESLGDRMARRAFYAAVFGCLLCPPLPTCYSVWLLLKIARRPLPLSQKGDRFFYWAAAIDVLVSILVFLVLGLIL